MPKKAATKKTAKKTSSRQTKASAKKTSSASKSTRAETFRVKGEELLKTVKKLVQEGNVRRVTILDKKGNPIVVIPLTIGVVGALMAPPLAAVGAVAALITECTIKVEREV